MRILIVEDEQALAKGLKFNFEQEGYRATEVGDGASALREFESAEPPYDLVVLDLMLPEMSGYEICRRLRQIDDYVPILVLSARQLSEDKTLAFDCGTDQYVTKPFALPELLSRVRNLLSRRSRPNDSPAATIDHYEFGNVKVDFATFELYVGGEKHSLTTMEMQLLRYFVENEGVVLSRAQILEDVWKEDNGISSRTIDNFVMRLRKLIEANPAEPRHILSVRGTGYRFVAQPDEAA
jgi:two-component system OmpR family response regulator